MAAKKKREDIAIAEKATKKILKLMGTKAKPSVSFDEESEAVVVDIETTEETGLLIGHRGETLNALQSIVGMIIRRKMGEWSRVIVNIGDWRAKQEDYLKGLASQAAERAMETGEPQTLYNLTPAQRRTIHLSLSEEKDLETESHGEEGERYLVVKPKGSKK
ncbi:KH domain-containing protein [Patescibacteria group bacterium]|nr:KH domain-containing protein [Patescibacteria group bacterium]